MKRKRPSYVLDSKTCHSSTQNTARQTRTDTPPHAELPLGIIQQQTDGETPKILQQHENCNNKCMTSTKVLEQQKN